MLPYCIKSRTKYHHHIYIAFAPLSYASHSRQEMRFHSFKSELKKSLKLEPDNQQDNEKIEIASIDNELYEGESELCSYQYSIWRPTSMKEIVFFLEESKSSKYRLKHRGFQTRSENQTPERVSVLDLVKSLLFPQTAVLRDSLHPRLLNFPSKKCWFLFPHLPPTCISLAETLIVKMSCRPRCCEFWTNTLFYL